MANRIGALIFLFVGIWKMNVAGDESPVWFWWLWIGVCVYGVIFPYKGSQDSDNDFDDLD